MLEGQIQKKFCDPLSPLKKTKAEQKGQRVVAGGKAVVVLLFANLEILSSRVIVEPET